ncbi:MAG: hypothetical protein JWO32_3033 [Bacteroidetes bacterium]|nr:hypothetical protein [Bacteroidota bacterium]
MRLLIIILFFFVLNCAGQDKIFLKDGLVKNGVILSMNSDYVFFKLTDTSSYTYKIPRNVILMMEKYDGKVFVYGDNSIKKDSLNNLPPAKRNSIGIQPFSFLTGRLTGVYERLNKKGTVGFCPVISLTFDPVGIIYKANTDTSRGKVTHNRGVNFIGGADVNFYVGRSDRVTFFVGPRVRYGVDLFLRSIEAYTVQTQFGWRIGSIENRFIQHVSFGLGFVRILSSQAGKRINPKQSYGWMSINYRIGINW